MRLLCQRPSHTESLGQAGQLLRHKLRMQSAAFFLFAISHGSYPFLFVSLALLEDGDLDGDGGNPGGALAGGKGGHVLDPAGEGGVAVANELVKGSGVLSGGEAAAEEELAVQLSLELVRVLEGIGDLAGHDDFWLKEIIY